MSLSYMEGNSYNTFDGLREYAYRVIELLFANESLWKMIKYDSPDANTPNNPNLTVAEKAELIWNGDVSSEGDIDYDKYRVFQQASTDNIFVDRTTQLRVYVDMVTPDTRIMSTTNIKIEILTHSSLNGLVDTKSTRLSSMLEETLKTLNGKDIDGIGNLYFNAEETRSNNAKYAINNTKNYLGYIIVMSTKTSSINESTC